MIDSHVHIDANVYSQVEHLDDIIGRARASGVGRMVTPALHLESFQRLKEISGRFPDTLFPAVGVHPHEASEERTRGLAQGLRAGLEELKIPILGETGLEGHYDFVPLPTQLDSLRVHLEVAQDTDAPVILHCRDCEEELYHELQQYRLKGTGVVHCFTGSWEWAQRFLELGFFIGITGIVTFKNAAQVAEVATRVPLDRLLVETDGPYLAPIPHRGRTNKPEYVPLIVNRIAELRQVSPREIAIATESNTERLFGLPKQSTGNAVTVNNALSSEGS